VSAHTPGHTCVGFVVGERCGGYTCGRRAKVERGGKWYCLTHDPERVAARAEARSEKWRRERDADHARYARQAAEQTETKRRAACYADLLAACEAAQAAIVAAGMFLPDGDDADRLCATALAELMRASRKAREG